MTVKYKPTFRGGGHREPRRMMTRGDLGLDLLIEYDPILLAAGIKVRHLTRRETNTMHAQAMQLIRKPPSEDDRLRMRENSRFWISVEGRAAKQKVRSILHNMRRLGEVRR